MTTGEEAPLWYLPHHPVINPNKAEKIRCVWKAASYVCRVSLNKNFVLGPGLRSELIGIFLRFRSFRVPLAMNPFYANRSFREPTKVSAFSVQTEVYQYTRHTFDATSSPTVASFNVQQVARDNRLQFRLAFEIVRCR